MDEKQIVKLEDVKSLSKIFYEAGIFEDVKSEAQAMVKIIAGHEYGLSPMESMNGLYIVKGRVVPMSQIISSLVKKSTKYDYSVVELTNEECTLSFSSEGKEVGTSTFTMKDAAKAGIINKDNWKNYPRNCLFARALANGCRWYCPDVFSGGVAEELMDLTTTPTKDEVVEIKPDGEVTVDGES